MEIDVVSGDAVVFGDTVDVETESFGDSGVIDVFIEELVEILSFGADFDLDFRCLVFFSEVVVDDETEVEFCAAFSDESLDAEAVSEESDNLLVLESLTVVDESDKSLSL